MLILTEYCQRPALLETVAIRSLTGKWHPLLTMGEWTKYQMVMVGGDLYLLFDSPVNSVIHRTQELFCLTKDPRSLQDYTGPTIEALLDQLGNALGIVVRLSGETGTSVPSTDMAYDRKAAEDYGFRLDTSGAEAYLTFPNFKPESPSHRTVTVTRNDYFRKGTYNPDVILDLDVGGSPIGIEILSRDKTEITLRLCPSCNFPNSSLDERCENCGQTLGV